MAQRRSGAVIRSGPPLWTQPQPPAAPARLGWLRLLPLFVIPFIVLGGFVLYAEVKYRPAAKPDPPGQPGVLVWGDGVFVSKGEISGWLRLHGGSFKAWKLRHPAALRLVSPAKPRRHAAAAAAVA